MSRSILVKEDVSQIIYIVCTIFGHVIALAKWKEVLIETMDVVGIPAMKVSTHQEKNKYMIFRKNSQITETIDMGDQSYA